MTTRKTQRLGNNSGLAQTKSAAGAVTDKIPVPKGVKFQSNADIVLWEQIISTRIAADWRDIDLLLAAKMVGIERDIRRYQETLDNEGPVVFTLKGTPVPNPLFSIVNTLQSQLLNIVRALNLTRTGTDPRTMNAGGKKQQQFSKLLEDADELIVRPN
jgi:hypothetical protein